MESVFKTNPPAGYKGVQVQLQNYRRLSPSKRMPKKPDTETNKINAYCPHKKTTKQTKTNKQTNRIRYPAHDHSWAT
jgi:hypothetical protein